MRHERDHAGRLGRTPLHTASGAVVCLLALDAIAGGAYGAAFAWMTLAFILDCTNGTLARARVKQVLPYFDGSKLDPFRVGR